VFSNPYGIKSRNIVIAYASSFLSGLLFFLPIWALYLQKSLFTVENVALIISIQAIATVLFEFPTGAVGDLFGRKRTILLGTLITFFSVIFLYIGGNIWMFIFYAILSSLGAALVTGTDGALIYDTLKVEKKEKYYKKILGTIGVLWPLGAAIASVVGGYLAQNSLSFPILITLVPLGLVVLLVPHHERNPRALARG